MTTNPHSPEDLRERVLLQIAHVRPRSRWSFLIENYVFWTLGALAVLLGALAFSAALFEVANAGWRLYAATHPDFFRFFLHAAPFLWALALIGFLSLGYVNIRRTRRGYRYPLSVIALGAVLSSITIGSAFYAIGLGSFFEGALGNHPPFYRPILLQERGWWVAPERGLLGGIVTSASPDADSFMLKDFSGRQWNVDGSALSAPDLIVVARGGIVRVVGLPTPATSSSFRACFVFPWRIFGLFRASALPPPLAVPASSTERSDVAARSEWCKGIRPYTQLRALDEQGL